MWLAAAAPSLARRLLFLGPPPPPLLLLLFSRSSRRRRRRLHSLGLAAMPEKRPFERLPADVSPINYSLCLKPDLLDFTFEGKLEAAAQVRRPSGAGGELRGKQLVRPRPRVGLGARPGGRAGGRAWALRAWDWGGWLPGGRAPPRRPRGAGSSMLCPAGLGSRPRCGERCGSRRAGPLRPSGASTPVWGIPTDLRPFRAW